MKEERERETEEGNVGCENGAEQTHPNIEVDAGIVRDLLLRVDVLGDVHGDPIATHVRDEKEAIQNDFAAIEVVYSFICFMIRSYRLLGEEGRSDSTSCRRGIC